MIMPNTEKTVITNVKDYLCHKVGQTVTTPVIAKETGETVMSVSGAMNALLVEGKLKTDKKIGNTFIYAVLPNISEARAGDSSKRSKRVTGTTRSSPSSISPFKIESGVKQPMTSSNSRIIYPFGKMKKGDSFKFPVPEHVVGKKCAEIIKVKNAADRYGRPFNKKFSVMRVGKKTARCWLV